MTAPAFRCDDNGQLWWTDWCWGDDDFARHRMARIAAIAEAEARNGVVGSAAIARECKRALRDYDFFWLEHIDADR